jgi:flagellar operon protein
MVVNNHYFANINKVNQVPGSSNTPVRQKPVQPGESFGSILQEKISENSGVKFSKHAELRLQTRNIQLTAAQKEKINNAVKKADEKGIRDAMVLVDNVALVVNVKNKTVITAVGSNELKDNVFTNIDGAVFA